MIDWKSLGIAFFRWFTNAGFFYLGWLICMHQAKGPHPYLGPLAVLGILIYHFIVTKDRWADAILCLSLALLGTIIDTIYILTGVFSFEGGYNHFPSIAPLWITSIWMLYAISINHSLSWMRYNILLAAGMGAGGAISSYIVGVKLGAAHPLLGPYASLIVVGCIWAVITPLTLAYGKWLQSYFLNKKQ